MSKTYKERLEAGLVALGYRLVPGVSRKYVAYHKEPSKSKLFVGKLGALRSGTSATGSFSLGDPSNMTAVYQRILAAADGKLATPKPFQYVVHWTEKDMITQVPRQCWQNFYEKEEANRFAAVNPMARKVEAIKDCAWHPMWKPTETTEAAGQ